MHIRFPNISSWDFDVFNYTPQELGLAVFLIFRWFGCLELFHVDEVVLARFVSSVRERYHNNPYHNWQHAVDVMQTLAVVLSTFRASAFLSMLEVFALLTAALCHDIDHPGLNNAYQVAAQSDLAVRYNDKGVLEQHHAASTTLLLRSPHTNITSRLPPADTHTFRAVVTSSILNTDMAEHFNLLKQFQTLLGDQDPSLQAAFKSNQLADANGIPSHPSSSSSSSSASASASAASSPTPTSPLHSSRLLSPSSPPPYHHPAPHSPPSGQLQRVPAPRTSHTTTHPIRPEVRRVVASCLLHAADISNPCKAWRLSKRWSDRVATEFFIQGDVEKARGLPVSMNCDRSTTKQPVMSLGFIDFIVAPLFVAVRNLLPAAASTVQTLSDNRDQWYGLLLEDLEKDTSTTEEEKEKARETWGARDNSYQQLLNP